jgi:PAS domain S-box-containing protein
LENEGDAAALRWQAEEITREQLGLSPEETRRTLHELRVHQIELDVQNEELRRAQVELEASRARYFDFYDLAPVGFYTISETGLMLEANLTAARQLGVARDALVPQPISRFILKEDQDIYYLHRKQLFETGEPLVCELRMVEKSGMPFWARLRSLTMQDTDGALVSRLVMSDITESKRVEEALQQRNAELERFNKVTVDRELRMRELKKEVNALLKAAGQPEKYRIVNEDEKGSR